MKTQQKQKQFLVGAWWYKSLFENFTAMATDLAELSKANKFAQSNGQL